LKQNFVHWPARADNHNARNDIIRHRIIVNLPVVQNAPTEPGISSLTRSLSHATVYKKLGFIWNELLKNVASSHFFLDAKNKFEARISALVQVKQNLNEIK
jgi:hypothetical protein